MNISINGIGNQNTQQQVKATVSTVNAPKEEKKGMTVFAGNLNMGQDPVKEKLESARKQAFKMVSDAWNTDRDFQKRLQDLKDFVAEQRSEKASAKQMANDAEKTMKDLNPVQMYQSSGQAEAALEELKNKMALIDVDLMGLKVDETV